MVGAGHVHHDAVCGAWGGRAPYLPQIWEVPVSSGIWAGNETPSWVVLFRPGSPSGHLGPE
jgi:hypothetical protein